MLKREDLIRAEMEAKKKVDEREAEFQREWNQPITDPEVLAYLEKSEAEATTMQNIVGQLMYSFARGKWADSFDALETALSLFSEHNQRKSFGRHSFKFVIITDPAFRDSSKPSMRCWMIAWYDANKETLFTQPVGDGKGKYPEGDTPYAEVRAREVVKSIDVELIYTANHADAMRDYLWQLLTALKNDGLKEEGLREIKQVDHVRTLNDWAFETLDAMIVKFLGVPTLGIVAARNPINAALTIYRLQHNELGEFAEIEVRNRDGKINEIEYRRLLLPPLSPNRDEVNRERQGYLSFIAEYLRSRLEREWQDLEFARAVNDNAETGDKHTLVQKTAESIERFFLNLDAMRYVWTRNQDGENIRFELIRDGQFFGRFMVTPKQAGSHQYDENARGEWLAICAAIWGCLDTFFPNWRKLYDISPEITDNDRARIVAAVGASAASGTLDPHNAEIGLVRGGMKGDELVKLLPKYPGKPQPAANNMAKTKPALAGDNDKNDSGHYTYPPKKRMEIVEAYKAAKARGEVENQNTWADNNYQISGKTLRNYIREAEAET